MPRLDHRVYIVGFGAEFRAGLRELIRPRPFRRLPVFFFFLPANFQRTRGGTGGGRGNELRRAICRCSIAAKNDGLARSIDSTLAEFNGVLAFSPILCSRKRSLRLFAEICTFARRNGVARSDIARMRRSCAFSADEERSGLVVWLSFVDFIFNRVERGKETRRVSELYFSEVHFVSSFYWSYYLYTYVPKKLRGFLINVMN